MEKRVPSVHLLMLLWTILGCVATGMAGRGGSNRRNEEQLDTGRSVTCYDCNSEYDPNCGEQFEPSTLGTVNCTLRNTPEHLNQTLSPIICRKLVMKIYGKVRVYRGCGYIESNYDDGACVKRSGTHDVHVWYCSCTTSLCNSATTQGMAVLTAAAAFLFAVTV